MNGSSLQRQLPHGVTDLYAEEAAIKVRLEQVFQQIFERWSYQRIILPTFEYYDSLITGASHWLQEEMYRFFDREGKVLALRPDMTVQTARVVGTKLCDAALPLRLYYIDNVFRYDEPQAGRRREFTQAGIELVGADTPEADAEVVRMAIASLQALDVEHFQINLGQMGFLLAILRDMGLSNGDLDRLEQAIGRKNDVELDRTLRELGIEGEAAEAIRAVPHLSGGRDVLDEARRLATNRDALEAIDRLEQIYDILAADGVAERVILDLSEVLGMTYYTGIVFHGYAEGLGFDLCRGGRYDDLIASFGPAMPAVGFVIGVERAMLITRMTVDTAPQIVMAGCACSGCRQVADWARAQGVRVETDVMGRTGEALLAYARERGARYALSCLDETTWSLARCDATDETTRRLDRRALEETLREEIASWNS